MKTHLEEGLAALLDIIGADAVSICESNSLRQVVEPGLFLIVKGRDVKVWKSSAQNVRKHADRIVVSDGGSFVYERINACCLPPSAVPPNAPLPGLVRYDVEAGEKKLISKHRVVGVLKKVGALFRYQAIGVFFNTH